MYLSISWKYFSFFLLFGRIDVKTDVCLNHSQKKKREDILNNILRIMLL